MPRTPACYTSFTFHLHRLTISCGINSYILLIGYFVSSNVYGIQSRRLHNAHLLKIILSDKNILQCQLYSSGVIAKKTKKTTYVHQKTGILFICAVLLSICMHRFWRVPLFCPVSINKIPEQQVNLTFKMSLLTVCQTIYLLYCCLFVKRNKYRGYLSRQVVFLYSMFPVSSLRDDCRFH